MPISLGVVNESLIHVKTVMFVDHCGHDPRNFYFMIDYGEMICVTTEQGF
jgi:hypothetical protein